MKLFRILAAVTIAFSSCSVLAQKREFYELKVYTLNTPEQGSRVEEFLKNAYVPALHRAGIKTVGVFKPVETDTVHAGKRIYVLIPFKTLDQFNGLSATLEKDKAFQAAGTSYIDAPYDNPPYTRVASILCRAFSGMTTLEVPKHSTPAKDRVYELRSYEGHTEKIFQNKVKMFNAGDEIGLFKRLGFNAVFYSEVIAGNRMPNLMYMTTFSNMDSRNEHWKTFVADPQWKTLSSMPEYQHNVSKIEIFLLHPTDYSDI
jgi:hypothetical protein